MIKNTKKEKAKEIGITASKEKNFSEWYNQTVLRSGLAEYSDIKGFMVIKPLGYAIWEKIQEVLDKEIKKTSVKNVYFPLFIPESLLKKEAEHFNGFIPEVAWVTKGGNKKLEEKLAIRPTSETIMYYTFSKWVRSHRDLPLLTNQWCSVVRWDTKATRLFLRTREFLWQEGHTVHKTKEEAEKRVKMMLDIYKRFVEEYLAIPVIDGEKSELEKFPGALKTTTIEALMPDGRSLQMGTSHNLGNHFSKVFNIKFFDADEKEKFAWQTSWGVSTRMIGAMIMVHGDDKGLIIPPKIAPIQAVIVPIFNKKNRNVLDKARKIKNELEEDFSIELDSREEYTPGWKFSEWELKGVPVRIEIGQKEIKNKELTLVRRDSGEKIKVKEAQLKKELNEILYKIQTNLYEKAKKFLQNNIHSVTNLTQFKKAVSKGGFVKAYWCGNPECEEKIKEETGAGIVVLPFREKKISSKCIYCGKKTDKVAYFARAY